MAVKNDEYWTQRIADEQKWQKQNLANDAKLNDKLEQHYTNALQSIQDSIDNDISRLASRDYVTRESALKAVSQNDIKQFESQAKQIVDESRILYKAKGMPMEYEDWSAEVNARLRLYNATMRINKAEYLKSKIGLEMTQAGMRVDADLQSNLSDAYQAEVKRQAGILSESYSAPNAKQVMKAVMATSNGATYSTRLWANQDTLKAKVDDVVSRAIIQGKNPKAIARQFRSELKNTVVNSRYVTERLARSEMARVQDMAQMDSFKKYGYDYCKWIAEPSACNFCKAFAQQQGGIYKVSEAPSVPAHANCRCSKSAWYKPSKILNQPKCSTK